MMRNNKKGITMIELLIVTAVAALVSPLIFWIFLYGTQSFSTYGKMITQHDKVLNVTQRIRKDIEEAAAVKVNYDLDNQFSELVLIFPDYSAEGTEYRTTGLKKFWRIEDEQLLLKTVAESDPESSGVFETVLDGLDTSVCTIPATEAHSEKKYITTRFEHSLANRRIILSIQPVPLNTAVHRNRNVTEPIITEFSVEYKEVIE